MTLILADVSEHQGAIDWAAYGRAHPAVIIRAHNGWRGDFTWKVNLAGARKHVPWRAFYQYLPASVDPAAAARAFAATVGPLEPGEVMILDLEEGAGDQRARRQAWLGSLTAPIEWTYSGLYFARTHLPGVRVEWLAAYGQAEPTDPHTLWQHTNAQRFAGITNPCDGNTFRGTYAQLVALTAGTPPPPQTLESFMAELELTNPLTKAKASAATGLNSTWAYSVMTYGLVKALADKGGVDVNEAAIAAAVVASMAAPLKAAVAAAVAAGGSPDAIADAVVARMAEALVT